MRKSAPRAPHRRTRGEQTETQILDAAERLFARHGLDGVSLRQIGAAAGSANNFGVQYHFGTKAQLVRAIFERRLPSLEVGRARLLTEAKRAGMLADPRTLLGVILRPLATETDSAGRMSYAAFLLGLRYFEGHFDMRTAVDELAPITSHVNDLLRALLPQVPDAIFRGRASQAYMIFKDAILEWDRKRALGGEPLLSKALMIEEALDRAIGSLLAPVSLEVAAALAPSTINKRVSTQS
jgi:AcrR family transcriptional regulator